jgi:hypothetical protein
MAGVYRPRHPERTVLYRVLFHYFDRFLVGYEGRFEKGYGYLRPVIKNVVKRYLDCCNPRRGFARIRRPDCGAQRLLMFSCRRRSLLARCRYFEFINMISLHTAPYHPSRRLRQDLYMKSHSTARQTRKCPSSESFQHCQPNACPFRLREGGMVPRTDLPGPPAQITRRCLILVRSAVRGSKYNP